jgi:hypothetical protein
VAPLDHLRQDGLLAPLLMKLLMALLDQPIRTGLLMSLFFFSKLLMSLLTHTIVNSSTSTLK